MVELGKLLLGCAGLIFFLFVFLLGIGAILQGIDEESLPELFFGAIICTASIGTILIMIGSSV